MTPDERAQLDAYAIRFGMDSEDVDEALARSGATWPRSTWRARL